MILEVISLAYLRIVELPDISRICENHAIDIGITSANNLVHSRPSQARWQARRNL